MKMKIFYVSVIVSLVVSGVFLVIFFPFQTEEVSVLRGQSEAFESLLPTESALPHGLSAESVSLFAQNVPEDVRAYPATPSVSQPAVPPLVEQQSAVVPLQPIGPTAPVSYIYFYTGVAVRPVPTATVVYTSAPVAPIVRPVVAPVPVVQSYSVPVFVPQIVPSRVGAPKLVYTNGVVIKPKVYYPRQPVRNSLRGVTP